MNPVYVPAKDLANWRALLAQPGKHWKENHSAMAIAKAWHYANGFPASVAAVFEAAGEPFASLVPLLILPEHKVNLPGGKRASQNDVWILASHKNGLASITVEGKVAESFGDTLDVWQRRASDGKKKRLESLAHTIGLPRDLPGTVRYQLLHRSASALIEAKRFKANIALMIVHSFSSENAGFADFQAFIKLFRVDCERDCIVRLSQPADIPLYAVWVTDAQGRGVQNQRRTA
jgi:hypothetical protein